MAVTAELAFHAVPLALLCSVVERARSTGSSRPRRLWACVAFVALIEPTFQIVLAGPIPGWLTAYLAAHLFAFSVAELWLFVGHDFVTMLAFRLIYYLCWHVIWGHARLELLF
jgi:hypothetical protein